MDKFVKKAIFLLFLFFSVAAFSNQIEVDLERKQKVSLNLPEDTAGVFKVKEDFDREGFGECLYTIKENYKLLVEYQKRDISLIKEYFDRRIDISSLLFDRFKENPSALMRMKELRQESLKKECPYSVWKLHHVFSRNDVIYENQVPKIGSYDPQYTLTRLIKARDGYVKISLIVDAPKTQETFREFFEVLKRVKFTMISHLCMSGAGSEPSQNS